MTATKTKGVERWVRITASGLVACSLLTTGTYARADDNPFDQGTQGGAAKTTSNAVKDIVDAAGYISNVYGAFQAAEGIVEMLGLVNNDDMQNQLAALHADIDQMASQVSWYIGESSREQAVSEMINYIRVGADDFNNGVDLSPGSNAGSQLDFNTAGLVASAMAKTSFERSYIDSQTDGAPVGDPVVGSFTWKTLISYTPADLGYQNGYVYDWRLGLPAFLQLLSLRIQAMAMEDPNFIQNGTFYGELMNYRDFLSSQYWTMYDAVRCNTVMEPPVSPDENGGVNEPNYRYLVSCADILSGINETVNFYVGAGYPVDPGACQTGYDSNYRPVYDQGCMDQRQVDYANWYQANVQALQDLALRNVWNDEPWYEVLAMYNTLFHYATGTGDPTQSGTHAIKMNANASLCLRAQNNGTDPGTIAEIHNCFSTDSERWLYDRYSENIVNVHSGLCLDVQWGNSAPATPVWTWDCIGTPAQRWTYNAEDGTFWNSLGYLLTAANWDMESGVPLVTWYDDGSDAQHWH